MRRIEDFVGSALLIAAALLMPLAALQSDGKPLKGGGACGAKLETVCAAAAA
jgi:hypothetical protein